MRIALELEFPDEQAASVIRLLQALSGLTSASCKLTSTKSEYKERNTLQTGAEKLTTVEQEALLHEVFGSWKSEESGEEMVRRLHADRQDEPREVAL